MQDSPHELFKTLAAGPSVPHVPPNDTPEAGGPLIRDWAKLISFRPRLYVKPNSLEELQHLLKLFAQGQLLQRAVRVPGSLHSCSDIYIDDAIIDVTAIPKAIEFSNNNSMVTVSANWTLHEFLLQLSLKGKSLSATGGTDAQSLAGLISTNTAPATSKHSLYDLLEWLEYVTVEIDGSVVTKRLQKNDPAIHAAVCSLGTIGIITKVAFSLVDECFFKTIQEIVPLKQVLSDLAATSQKYDFWRIDWVPDMDVGLLWAAKQVPRDQAKPDGDYPTDHAESILKFLFTLWDKVGKRKGPLLDDAMRMIYKVIAGTYNIAPTKATGPLRNMLPVDRRAPLHVAMAEWSFRPADLNSVIAHCKTYYSQNGWPNLPIEIELTKTDRNFMSPWNWSGLDFVVKLNFMYLTDVCTTPEEKQQIYTHLQGLWNFLRAKGIAFKAHWGKINFMDYEFVRTNYELDKFTPFIRPVFLNQYLAQRLKPTE